MLELDFVGCFPVKFRPVGSRSQKESWLWLVSIAFISEHKVKLDSSDGEGLPNVAICNDISN
eukprot:3046205-Pleurochrysis_carterae.AAC.1